MSKKAESAPEATAGPTPSGVEGVVDEGRLSRLAELGDAAMAKYGGQPEPEAPKVERELVNQPRGEDGKFLSKDPEAPEAAPEVTPEPEAPAAVEAAPETYEIKVNGRTLKLTKDELIARAQKVEAADEYLRGASQAFKAVRQPEPKAPEPVQSAEEDDAALASAIQTGTEEEARAAIAKLRARPPQGLSQDDVLRAVDQRIAFQDAARKFQTEFKDVFEDSYLLQIAMTEDQKLIQSGDTRGYWDRFSEIGTKVRQWRDGIKGQPVPNDKQQRKASVTVIPTAAARAAGKTEDKPETATDVIAEMARQRQAR